MRLVFNGKEYRHDVPEARKKIQEMTTSSRLNVVMVLRLPGGI